MIPVFIGYDTREIVAFHVCVDSIVQRSSEPLAVTPLALQNLCHYRERHGDGSNQFVYTRFLVPSLREYSGWAIYLDGDMVLCDDIAKLWALRDDQFAVMSVKHDYRTKARTKYLGSHNEDYPRKNWSSVMLWNCAHTANRTLDRGFVERSTGKALHRFEWLRDEHIGALPIEWNWLPDEFGVNSSAKLLHWTLGTPCYADYGDAPMSELWHQARQRANSCTDPK